LKNNAAKFEKYPPRKRKLLAVGMGKKGTTLRPKGGGVGTEEHPSLGRKGFLHERKKKRKKKNTHLPQGKRGHFLGCFS